MIAAVGIRGRIVRLVAEACSLRAASAMHNASSVSHLQIIV
jgi:hypothetical protein